MNFFNLSRSVSIYISSPIFHFQRDEPRLGMVAQSILSYKGFTYASEGIKSGCKFHYFLKLSNLMA